MQVESAANDASSSRVKVIEAEKQQISSLLATSEQNLRDRDNQISDLRRQLASKAAAANQAPAAGKLFLYSVKICFHKL